LAGIVNIGKALLYPVEQLEGWDQKNLVACRASPGAIRTAQDRA